MDMNRRKLLVTAPAAVAAAALPMIPTRAEAWVPDGVPWNAYNIERQYFGNYGTSGIGKTLVKYKDPSASNQRRVVLYQGYYELWQMRPGQGTTPNLYAEAVEWNYVHVQNRYGMIRNFGNWHLDQDHRRAQEWSAPNLTYGLPTGSYNVSQVFSTRGAAYVQFTHQNVDFIRVAWYNGEHNWWQVAYIPQFSGDYWAARDAFNTIRDQNWEIANWTAASLAGIMVVSGTYGAGNFLTGCGLLAGVAYGGFRFRWQYQRLAESGARLREIVNRHSNNFFYEGHTAIGEL